MLKRVRERMECEGITQELEEQGKEPQRVSSGKKWSAIYTNLGVPLPKLANDLINWPQEMDASDISAYLTNHTDALARLLARESR